MRSCGRGSYRIVSEDERGVIGGWCLEQLAPWLRRQPDPDDAVAERARQNHASHDIFLVSIKDGQVSIAEKPRGMPLPQVVTDRIALYAAFFQEVTREHRLDIDTTFVLHVGDGGGASDIVPVFGFQKQQGDTSVLIPDIDFLAHGFYEADAFHDTRIYSEKMDSAIFVGSTSGALYTEAAVLALAPPRLRAAAYFRDIPEVTFLLPNVVQCDAPDTEALLRSMGFGDGRHVIWREQLQYKFVLSMDGNGATCSRVVVALRSNSVLVKYASPYVLYYFSQLVPWFHYIPVAADADVERVVAMERGRPGLFDSVARQGRTFAERYLNKRAVQLYTAQLLRLYAEDEWKTCHSHHVAMAGRGTGVPDEPIRLEYLAHIQNRGDVWADAAGWAGSPGSKLHVEGIFLLPVHGLAAREIDYQVITDGGAESSWASAGEFCGSRGASLPIIGFRIRVLGACTECFTVTYSATFIDGSCCGPFTGGDLCISTTGASVEALNVIISCKSIKTRHANEEDRPSGRIECDGGRDPEP